MKVPFGKREFIILAAMLIFAFVVRIAFFPVPGYQADTGVFTYWFNTAAEDGVRPFYEIVWRELSWNTDYPPFNVYIFWAFGSLSKLIAPVLGSDPITYIIKLPANIFDMGIAFMIFVFVRKYLTFEKALIATSLYAFNPAVILDAAVWGQLDPIYTFFLVLSLFLLLNSKPKWAAASFMIAVLTKPQSIALAPLLIFLTYKKYNWRGLFYSILVAIATVFLVIIPFEWSNPVAFLSRIYFGAYGNYAYTSINAFNLWGLHGMWQPDTQFSFFAGWAMFGAVSFLALYLVHKRFSDSNKLPVIFAAFVLFFSFFMLPTRMHERYLFPAISMLALMFPFIKKTRSLFAVLTATCFVNQAYVLYWLNAYAYAGYDYGPNLSGDPVGIAVSVVNLIALAYVVVLMLGELWGRKWLTPNSTETQVNMSKEASVDATVE